MQLKLTGPIMVACQWNKSSPMGPAEQEEGGSRSRSLSSYYYRLEKSCVFNPSK